MITIGRTIRWYNNYRDEVNFCKENNFDFMQISLNFFINAFTFSFFIALPPQNN